MDPRATTGEPRTDEWRSFHAGHLERQTRATEQIRNYVAVWFWLSMLGAAFLLFAAIAENA